MPTAQRTRTLNALLAIAVLGGQSASGQEDVTVIVTNARELVAASPDKSLVKDVFDAIGERDLSLAEFSRAEGVDDTLMRTILLISLASPEAPTQTNSNNATIKLSPIKDFDAFVKAIDYGDVVARDDQQRAVKIKVRPAEIDRDRLRARLDKSDSDIPFALTRTLKTDEPKGFGPAAGFGGGFDEAPTPSASRLGAAIDPGDYVEIDLGGKAFAAEVTLTQRKHLEDTACLVLTDKASLSRALTSRRLRARLDKADSFTFWAPLDRLRKLPGPPVANPVERTWTDVTGKFKVVATYGGLDGDKVRLVKPAGNEVKVPLARLCDADQKYVETLQAAAAANPFAEKAPATTPGSLRADWSSVRAIRPRESRRWKFTPPAAPAATALTPKVTSLEVDRPVDNGPFGEDIERLFLASDASSAVVLLTTGIGKDSPAYLQRLDFVSGKAEALIELPRESKVLDADPVQRLVLLAEDKIGSGTARVYVHRLDSGGLTPVSDWDPTPPKSFHKGLDDARVIADGRVMTRTVHGPWVVWDPLTAHALHLFDLGGGWRDALTLAHGGRVLIADSAKAIEFIDLTTGKHLVSLPHGWGSLDNLSVNPDLTRLAVAKGKALVVVDLKTGEVVQAIRGGILQRADIDFMGDLLLVDDEYLVEPTYPIMIWQYTMARPTGDDFHAAVCAGRLWYAVRNKGLGPTDQGPWNVVSIPAPHDAIQKKLSELGDLDSLVILNEGDEVSVEVDTDLDAETAERLKAALGKALVNAGYKVVEGPAEKQAVVICRASETPIEVRIADPDAKPPANNPTAIRVPRGFGTPLDDWRFTKRSVKPYYNAVVLRRRGQVLWADAPQMQPGTRFFLGAEETVDTVVQRINSPDIERLENVSLPGRLCRRGDATPYGAYGVSTLDAEGIVKDVPGNPIGD